MMNNILIIEYVKDTGSKDVKMVAMFNKRIITETEVKKLIFSGDIDIDDRVINMRKEQYQNLIKE